MNNAPPFKFNPGNRAGGNFQAGYRDIGRKNGDLGNRGSPPSYIDTSKFLQRERVVRRDLRNCQPGGLTGLIWRGS